MNRILVDTNVLIEIWRNPGSEPAVLHTSSKWINTITYIEFLQGANLKTEAKGKKVPKKLRSLAS